MLSTPLRKRMLWALVWVCASSLLLGVFAMISLTLQLATEVRDTQLEGTPTGKKLVASADRILDCTDSQGECYKRNQARSASLVADLNEYQLRVAAVGAACSSSITGEDLSIRQREVRIYACMTERLSRDGTD